MTYIDRRQSILLTTAAVFAASNVAFGQGLNKLLATSVADGFALQTFAISASTDKDFAEFVTRDFYARQSTVYHANDSKLFATAESAQSYLKSIIGESSPGVPADYFSEENITSQIQVVSFVASEKVSLVPEVADIRPIGIPSIDPIQNKTKDTDFGVVLDIALQIVGIASEKVLIDEILKDNDVSTQLNSMVPVIEAKDWKKLLELADKLLKIFIATRFMQEYAKKAGIRIAFKLGLRCVPIVGWVYVVAAFLVAVRANYHRFSFA